MPAWLTGAAIFGVIAASWDKLRWMIGRLFSVFVVHVCLEKDLARAISLHCWKNMRRSPFGMRRYSCFHEFVRPVRKNQVVAFETIGKDPIMFWQSWWRPLLLGETDDRGNDDGPGHTYGRRVSLTFIRGTYNMDKLIIEATDLFNTSMHKNENRDSRFYVEHVYGRVRLMAKDDDEEKAERGVAARSINHLAIGDRRILKWKLDQLGPGDINKTAAMSYLEYPTDVTDMVQEAKYWLKSRKWYADKGIPWKRGWLLYGKTGTGKTALIRALAQELDMPVWIFDIASLSNEEMAGAWNRMLSRVPCIALIEDMDNVFEGRKNKSSEWGGAMTFDGLLNTVDGVEPSNGVFFVVTTNRIDKLDAALGIPREGDTISTRPGRIDRVMEFKDMTEDCRQRLAERILIDFPAAISDAVKAGHGDTGAQFQDRCIRVVLESYWKNKHLEDTMPEDEEEPVAVAIDTEFGVPDDQMNNYF